MPYQSIFSGGPLPSGKANPFAGTLHPGQYAAINAQIAARHPVQQKKPVAPVKPKATGLLGALHSVAQGSENVGKGLIKPTQDLVHGKIRQSLADAKVAYVSPIVSADRAILRPVSDVYHQNPGKAVHDTAQLSTDVNGGGVNTFAKGLASTPKAIYREVQNKPVADIQKKVFGADATKGNGAILKNLGGATLETGLAVSGGAGLAERSANKATEAAIAAKNAQSIKTKAVQATLDVAKPKTTNLLGAGKNYAKNRIAEIDNELSKYTGGVGSKITAPEKTLDNLGTESKVSGSKGQLQFNKSRSGGNITTSKGTTAGTVAPEAGVATPNKSAGELRALVRERKQLQANLDSANAPKAPQNVSVKPTAPVRQPANLTESLASVEKPVSQAATKLKPGVESFGSKTTVLSKLGDAGKKLAGAIQNVDKTHLDLRTGYENAIPTVLKLKGKSVENFFDAAKGIADPVTPQVEQAVKEWKTLSPTVRNDFVETGGKIGKQANYIPQSYDLKDIQKNPAKYDAALTHLVDTGQAKTKTEAKSLFDSFAHSTGGPHQFGHFEAARKLDLPGYKKNINVIRQYLDSGARRTAEATHLGANNEKAVDLINQLHPSNQKLAKTAIRNYLHVPEQSGVVNKGLAGTRAIFGAARLGKAGISHAGQTSNLLLSAHARDLVRGVASAVKPADRVFARSTGVLHPSELHGLVEQATGLSGPLGRATAPGLTKIMQANRTIAAVAGRHYAQNLAGKIGSAGEAKAVARLKELGVEGDISKTLTPKQEVQAARGVVKETMFDRSRANTPVKAETSAGKTIGQYRLAYGYKQTGLIHKRVLSEAKNGNLGPLTRYLALSAPVAGATIAAKNKISGSKEGKGGILADTVGALGGIPGELAVQGARYGKKDVLKTVASSVAPIAGEAVDVGERTQKAIQGDAKPIGRYGAGLVPVVGNRVSAKAFPYDSKTAIAAGSKDQGVANELQKVNYTVKDTNRTSGRAAQLSDKQYQDYLNQSGKIFAQKVHSAQADPDYRRLSTADKKATLSQALGDSRKQVLNQMIGKPTRSTTRKYKKY